MAEEGAAKGFGIPLRQGADLLLGVGVAADHPLAEEDQRAGEDVRPLDGDADRRPGVAVREEVARPPAEPGAAEDVHAVEHEAAQELGLLELHHRRDHGGLVAGIDGAAGVDPGGLHQVGEAGDAGERLLDPLEAADGRAELPAHGRVGAGDAGHPLGAAHGLRRQRDRPPRRERLHQHLPPPARAGRAADHGVERHHHVVALGGAVGEGDAQRIVAPADLDAGGRGGYEDAGDPHVLPMPKEVLRIAQPDGEAQQGGDRGEGDVALPPTQPQGEPAVPGAEDDPFGGERGGVGAGLGLGEGEAGDLLAAGEAGEVEAALLPGAVGQEELGRADRIGDEHHGRERQRSRGELAEDAAARQGREAEAAEFLGDGEAEEALALEKGPDLGGELPPPVELPGVHHAADLLDRAVEERALALGQARIGLGEHAPEVRPAGEEFAVHPHRPRLQGFALGVGDAGEEGHGLLWLKSSSSA